MTRYVTVKENSEIYTTPGALPVPVTHGIEATATTHFPGAIVIGWRTLPRSFIGL